MSYPIEHIATVIDAEAQIDHSATIVHLLLDSRKIFEPSTSLFFAVAGPRRNGHQFIPALYEKGVRNFVISDVIDTTAYPGANFLKVGDTVAALQSLAASHRSGFSIPVIGITGSNGKTIVKEWLYQLLHDDYAIARSPRSFNSQIGVPLSVWQLNSFHSLGIFEAGVSQPAEMIRLERVIQPTIGVLTNLGEAHSEGFNDVEHKFREKISLFRNCKLLVGRAEDLLPRREVIDLLGEGIALFTWGTDEKADLRIGAEEATVHSPITAGASTATTLQLHYRDTSFSLVVPFTDRASIENALTCCCVLLQLGMPIEQIVRGIARLHAVNMRLELKNGINQTTIINDSYSNDLSSLDIALHFLNQQPSQGRKIVFLSDFLQSAVPDEALYAQVLERLQSNHIDQLLAIGPRFTEQLRKLEHGSIAVEAFDSTEHFLQQFRTSFLKAGDILLVKGARSFSFERIVQLLERKVHETILEINLNAIVHNLKEYQRVLKPATKVMAMVKAFAYGSGGTEVASMLQHHQVDYLGVAYADEGVELRKAGVTLPVMVMNTEESAFGSIVEYQLQPDIFSFELLERFDRYLREEGLEKYPIHIEIETGMNRLGFSVNDIGKLTASIRNTTSFRIESVFSHLAASEDPAQDTFTQEQFHLFQKATDQIARETGQSFIRHIANSAAAIRHPQLQLDMVRLGIGLYGVDSAASTALRLQTVTTLRSTIAQIKQLKEGESVSYNRRGVVAQDAVIATIRLGYADGYPRRLSNGVGKVWIRNTLAPVIGTICMDMFMVDITHIPGVREGDEVIVFGAPLPVQTVAGWAGTIPYEIMTGISQRVKRVYFEE